MSVIAERRDSEAKKERANRLMPKGLILRCIVFENKPGEYTAECIDLDLMARGRTPHDALRSLKEAVVGYLNVAFTGDPSGLVPRPSPLSHRLRYHWYALCAALSIGARGKFLLSDWTAGALFC